MSELNKIAPPYQEPATDRQIAYINRLSGSPNDEFVDFVIDRIKEEGWDEAKLTADQASKIIKWLQNY